MLILQPGIVRDGSLTELPRPIVSCRLHDAWDFQKLKVPRQDGDIIAGTSQDGVEIRIEGQIGSVSGELKLSEEQMFEAVEELRAALQPVPDEAGYELVLFRSSEGEARSLRHCTTIRLDVDFSSRHLFAYTLAIHAADPVIYSELSP